jgi:hypothetical protein
MLDIEHWLTLRKFTVPGTNKNLWFNLNSLLPKPQHLGDLYLDTFLNSLASRGYDLFVVMSDNGVLPAPQKALEGGGGEWFRVTTTPTITVHERAGAGAGSSTRSGATSALSRLSRAAKQQRLQATDEPASDDDNADLDLAIAASMAEVDADDDDTDLKAAIAGIRNILV